MSTDYCYYVVCESQIQLKFEFEKSYKQRGCNDKTTNVPPTLFSKHEIHYHNFRSVPTNSELFFSYVDYESTILDPFLNSDQVLFLYINIYIYIYINLSVWFVSLS